jgi:hypothetical protein
MKVRLIFKRAIQISPEYDMAIEHRTFDLEVSPDQLAALDEVWHGPPGPGPSLAWGQPIGAELLTGEEPR